MPYYIDEGQDSGGSSSRSSTSLIDLFRRVIQPIIRIIQPVIRAVQEIIQGTGAGGQPGSSPQQESAGSTTQIAAGEDGSAMANTQPIQPPRPPEYSLFGDTPYIPGTTSRRANLVDYGQTSSEVQFSTESQLMLASTNNPLAANVLQILQNERSLFTSVIQGASSVISVLSMLFQYAGQNEAHDTEVMRAIAHFQDDTSARIGFGSNLCGNLECTQFQIDIIHRRLPDWYIAEAIGTSWYNQIPQEYWSSEQYSLDMIAARQHFLSDLFIRTAERANIQQYSGLSNEAAAAFMLSMVRLETDNWDPETDTSLNLFDRARITSNLQFSVVDLESHIWLFQDIHRLTERLAGHSDRVAGASYGIPNIYMGQLDEAWAFHENSGVLDINQLRTDRGLLSYFPRDVNEDPVFAMTGLNLILNWAGVRGRIPNAGNEDFPAVRFTGENMNFEVNSSPSGEISAFSLAVTRYSDAVYTPEGFAGIANSDRFSAMLRVVEGLPSAAAQLGLSVGEQDQNIILGEDFIPYTRLQAQAIVESLREYGLSPAAATPLNDAEIQEDFPLLWYVYQQSP